VNAVIVGAGLSGLAAASILSSQGIKVTVIEKNNNIGGRARVFHEKGYTFDMGPSWYLMPDMMERVFKISGQSTKSYFKLKKLNPSFDLYVGNNKISIKPELSENFGILDSYEKDGYNNFLNYLEVCKSMYDKTVSKLLYKEFNGPMSMVSPSVIRTAMGIKITKSMKDLSELYFKSTELRYLTQFSSVFLGGSPSTIPAVYSMVNYSIFKEGVFYPENGFGSLVDSLRKIAEDNGATFVIGSPVISLDIENNIINNVRTAKARYNGDFFIFNADYHYVEQELLPKMYRNYNSKYWEKKKVSPSAVLAYIGLKGKPNLSHHTIFTGKSWDEHFNSIDNSLDKVPDNFSFYAALRSYSNDNIAPEGNSNLFILIPVSTSYNDNLKNREKLIKIALKRMEQATGYNFNDNIDYIKYYGKSDFQNDYNSFLGSAFGIAQTMQQTAGFRPSMRNKKIKNMFYAGQFTHPGIGVPMAMISGEIVSAAVKNYSK
jgi:phytoene desaturase